MLVALLIAIGAVSHATWNLLAKSASLGGPTFVWLTSVGATVVVAPIAVVLWINDPPRLGDLLIAVIVSGVIHIAYFLSLQAGYRVGDVSVVYPLARGTGPLLSVVFAVVLFGERPGLLGALGAGAVVAGVMVIGFSGGRIGWSSARVGVIWGLLTGITIAAYTLWDAHAVTTWALSPLILTGGTSAVEALLLAPVALRSSSSRTGIGAVMRTHWVAIIAVSVLSPLAYILILQAIQLAPVSIVAPAREVSVVLVGLAGWLIFKEPHPVRRLTGAAVVLAGVALLALSRT